MKTNINKGTAKAKDILTYKAYTAHVRYSALDDCFIGRIAGINDVIGFHAESVLELHKAFEEAVDDYIITCKKAGKLPQKPCSGNVLLRITPELHVKVAMQAEAHGKSLNSWVAEVLATA